MNDQTMAALSTAPEDASAIIDGLGGTAKVAKLCGVSSQSVSEWRKRGIPKGWAAALCWHAEVARLRYMRAGVARKMTKDEWIAQCAARYQERAGLTPEQAKDAAEACFSAESGEPGFEFSEAVEYSPEDCADEDMSNWTDGGEE